MFSHSANVCAFTVLRNTVAPSVFKGGAPARCLCWLCPSSLGPLVSKVKEYQVETIVDTLCTNMLSDKEQLRDISSIGLKTVIGELPPASSGNHHSPHV